MNEKEIFEILKKACILDENCYEVDCLFEEDLDAIRELIKLYKKQKQEIEELNGIIKDLDDRRVSKYKIRDKIEELEELLYNGEIKQRYASIAIDTLNDLLEE